MRLAQSCSFLISINSRISICPRVCACAIVADNPANCKIIFFNKKQQFVLNWPFFDEQIRVNIIHWINNLIYELFSTFLHYMCFICDMFAPVIVNFSRKKNIFLTKCLFYSLETCLVIRFTRSRKLNWSRKKETKRTEPNIRMKYILDRKSNATEYQSRLPAGKKVSIE